MRATYTGLQLDNIEHWLQAMTQEIKNAQRGDRRIGRDYLNEKMNRIKETLEQA